MGTPELARVFSEPEGSHSIPVDLKNEIALRSYQCRHFFDHHGMFLEVMRSDPELASAIIKKCFQMRDVCLIEKINERIHFENFHDLTTLHAAAWSGNRALVELLVTHFHPDTNAVDSYGIPVLQAAELSGNPEVSEFLIRQGADPARPRADLRHTPPGDWPRGWIGASLHTELLVSLGANPNAVDSKGWTSLCGAARYGDSELVKFLLEKGADLDIVSPDGQTPLCEAVRSRNKEAVELLLRYGANPNVVDPDGQTPLFDMAKADVYTPELRLANQEIGELLLRFDANPNAVDRDGRSVLEATVGTLATETVRLLLSYGANPKVIDHEGLTPLFYLVKNRSCYLARDSRGRVIPPEVYSRVCSIQKEIGDLLILFGANPNAVDRGGRSVVEVAVLNGHREFAEHLRQMMALPSWISCVVSGIKEYTTCVVQ